MGADGLDPSAGDEVEQHLPTSAEHERWESIVDDPSQEAHATSKTTVAALAELWFSQVDFAWAWNGEEGERTVNFTEQGDVRESLSTVVGEIVDQVVSLVQRLTS